MAREIFKQLIEMNTTDSVGDVSTASEAMAKRLLEAGMARANVNCRIFPGEEPQEVEKTLEKVVNDPGVTITPVLQIGPDAKPVNMSSVPASPLIPEVVQTEERVVDSLWPGLPVLPTMSTGASDGTYLRVAGIPTYGIACMFYDVDDNRAHGKGERQKVQFFHEGIELGYRLIRALGGAN
jgi:acetylornithine deacetylase/succinyl-diaminopimelate desuccinylase-like protein